MLLIHYFLSTYMVFSLENGQGRNDKFLDNIEGRKEGQLMDLVP